MTRRTSDHDDEMAAVHWEFDIDEEEPSVDVAEVIAELDDRSVSEGPSIYRTIDDMIEQLFSDPPAPEAQAVLQFSYEGYRITLNQDGHATFMRVADAE
jgi:hypothetical protein